MEQAEFLTVLNTTLVLILKLSGPVLLASMGVGLSVGILQSVTQIQEATLTFVPKILAGILTVMFMAPWMTDMYIKAVHELFTTMIINVR